MEEILRAVESRSITPQEALRRMRAASEQAAAPVPDSRSTQGGGSFEQVRLVLIGTLAKALFMEPGDVKLDQPYVDMGLDSIIGVEWMKEINQHFHLDLPTTALYDHPTIEQLASHIAGLHRAVGGTAPPPAPPPTPTVEHAAVAAAAAAADTDKALVISGVQTLDEVVLAAWDPGLPSPGEITVQVKASAINFPDVMCVNGLYPTMPAYPFVPGFEVAGVVVGLGTGVTRFEIGDEVVALAGEQLGGHAARVNLPEGNAAKKPAQLSFAEACSLPVAFSTVHHAFSVGDLQAGEQVLVQTATGACGLVALQMARLRGAVCIGTSSREHKLDLLRRLHVEHALDYRQPFDETVRRLTGGRGVDVVLNMLSGEAIQRGLNCLAPSGRYLEIAVHGLKTSPKLSLAHLLQNQSIHSMDLRSLQFATGHCATDYLAEMVRLLDEGKLVPIVSRIYPVGQVREALEFVGRAQHIGKVVLSREHTQMVDLTETCVRRMLAQEQRAREDGSERHGRRPDVAAAAPVARPQSASHAAIAVIGMAGQFPMAESVDQFWDNVASGRDCVSQVSADRWSVDEFYSPDPLAPGKTHCKWLGQLADADKFDPLFFNISPVEAQAMDPQQRLLLQNSWACVEDAGLDPASLSGQACGVFIGAAPGDYGTVGDDSGLDPNAMMGNSQSILAARSSFFLNLKGPCITLDTACSSALVAVAEACNHLRLGHCRLALAGGVNVMASPQLHIMMGKAGMLSASGRCYTFDQRANGLVPAESVGLVLLKRLDDALADGDSIQAVIRGWGINQDGKTNGITAPSAASQAQLEAQVYETFGIDPSTITLIEAHGTGTKLGDPIEVRALTEAFRKFTSRKAYCALGSVKSNIGHAMAAAGIAGFIKAVLALRNRQLPPSVHFEQLNEHVQLEDTPFYISTRPAAWQVETGAVRRAAVSSFGFSGTNAHVVLEEAPAGAVGESAALPLYPVALSARTPDQLKAQVARLLAHLERHALLRIGDLSYTLACGRKHFGHRLITLAASTDELRVNLERWLRGDSVAEVLVSSQTRGQRSDATAQAGGAWETFMAQRLADCVRLGELHRAGVNTPEVAREYREQLWALASGYAEGKPVAFGQLLPRRQHRPLSLPTYPFARERHWQQLPPAGKPVQAPERLPAAMGPLHPLLQRNTSDLEQQRFSSICTGEEFYLADHVVEGHRVLPGVAYLEMAREAVMRSAPAAADATVMLRNVVWLRPLVVDGPRSVHIDLADAGEGDIDFEVYSTDVADGPPREQPMLHAQGRASLVMEAAPAELLDLASLRQRCDRTVDVADCYAGFAAAGLAYGPAHRGLAALRVGRDAEGQPLVVAEVELPPVVSDSAHRFILHPGILDCALQASIAWDLAGAAHETAMEAVRPALPFALEKLAVCGRTPTAATVVIRQAPGSSRKEVRKLDVDICDASGRVCVRLLGFSSRTLNEEGARAPSAADAAATPVSQTLLCKPVWTVTAVPGASAPAAAVATRCVLLGPSFAGVAGELASRSVSVQWAALLDHQAAQLHGPAAAAPLGRQLFARVRGLLLAKPQSPVLIQVVLDASSEGRACALALSALLRTAQLENPRFLGQVIELSGAASGSEILAAVEENARTPEVPHIRYGAGAREVALMRELGPVDGDAASAARPWADGGVYLITGGAGGLGSIFAREILARSRDARVILTGRSAPGEAIQQLLRSLVQAGNGAHAEYRVLDVADAEATAEAVRAIVAQHGALNGIVHAAGIARDNFIYKKSEEEFAAGLAAKMQGTLNLDLASRDCALDCFILFSSVSGVFGNPGQADYALANGFMDGFAACRNEWLAQGQRRGRSLSLNWPLWADGGMQVDAAVLEQARRRGADVLATADGLDALYHAWRSGESQVVVLSGDRGKFAASLGWASPAPPRPQGLEAAPPLPAGGEVDAGMLLSRIQRLLVTQISQQLKVKEDDVDVRAELSEFGFDSISLTTFGNTLNQLYGLELAPTIFFEHPTVQSFAEYLARDHRDLLVEKLGLRATGAVPRPTPPAPAPVANVAGAGRRRARTTAGRAAPETGADVVADPVAIVGMSGVFPGAADLDQFWQNLLQGETSISEIPPGRWDWRSIYGDPAREPGKTNIKWGGFIEGVDEFDPLFFNISPLEAVSMDPQHRLLMTHVWRTIEDAGYAPQSLSGSRTAIFVGTGSSGYRELVAQVGTAAEGYDATSGVSSIGPNRMSFLLNLHGPSEPIETACSSSLVAIHRSVRAIQAGDCEQAIAGGVNTMIVPWVHIAFGKAGMLCPDGRCKAFSKDANGYVRGEGVGMLFLKKLSCAERDGDHIHGLIRASRENHGGRANSLTAPNPKAQAELIKAAFREARIDPSQVSYIETHGTGTQLGDPIEINGLKMAFADLSAQGGGAGPGEARCGLGSVKSNIGHLELAAGVAGVIKVLLQMRHRTLVKTLHCEEINPYIDFAGSPFYLVRETQSWEAPRAPDGQPLPRMAGVSSFGFGGVNAHVVIEEYVAPARAADERQEQPRPALIVLSARTEDRLHAQARQLLAHVERRAYTDDQLASIAYTLQLGRDAMDVRLAFTAQSIGELKQRLADYLEGRSDPHAECYHGEARKNRDALSVFSADDDAAGLLRLWLSKRKHAKLMELWVKGLSIDWALLYEDGRHPARLSLPAYPFASERYWIGQAQPALSTPAPASPAAPAPAPVAAPQWLEIAEQWRVEPQRQVARSVRDVLGRRGSPRVLILHRDAAAAGALRSALGRTRVGDASMVVELVELPGDPLASDRPLSLPLRAQALPDVVFYLGDAVADGDAFVQSELPRVLQAGKTLMAAAGSQALQFFYCYLRSASSVAVFQEGLSGLFRAMVMECPRHVYRGIEYSGTRQDEDFAALIEEWLGSPVEAPVPSQLPMVRLRDGLRQVISLARAPARADAAAATPLRRGATYLMAGALGEVGQAVCHELARSYGARLVIFSRRARDADTQKILSSLTAEGAAVFYRSVDLTDRARLAEALASVKAEVGQLDGVFHFARAVSDGPLLHKEPEAFRRTMAAKVSGTLNLDELTAQEPLAFFVAFSSMAAFGIAGSADYGYASAFQNALMRERHRRQLANERSGRSLALCWGQWRADAYSNGQRDAVLASMGFDFIEAPAALAKLEQALGSAATHEVLGAIAVRDERQVSRLYGLDTDDGDVLRPAEHMPVTVAGGLSVKDLVALNDDLNGDEEAIRAQLMSRSYDQLVGLNLSLAEQL